MIKIEQKYSYSPNKNIKQQKPSQNLSFASSTPAVLEKNKDFEEAVNFVSKKLGAELDKNLGLTGKFSKFLAKHDGEIQTQLINAAFTTTLAPLFIAWNPFSNQDKKTKEYTALRQPISAGIAISGGLAMTMGINHYMNKMGSEGYIDSIDLRVKPNEEYLKGEFKREYKAAKEKSSANLNAFLEANQPDELPNGVDKFKPGQKKPTKDYIKACMDNYISKKHAERKNLFIKLISADPNSIKIDEKTKVISMVERDAAGKETIKILGENIPNLSKEKELTEYLKRNNLHNINFSDFMKEHLKFEFHENGQFKRHILKEKLSNTLAMDFLRKIGLFEKDSADETELVRILSIFRQDSKTVKSVNNAFQEKVFKEDGARSLTEAIGKHIKRIIEMTSGEKAIKTESLTLNQFFHMFGLIDDFGNAEKLQSLMNKKVSVVLLEDFAKKFLKDLKIAAKTGEKELNNETITEFAKNILSNKINIATSNFKNYKNYTGIAFNLFTTAITCTVLNWSYPRIVAALFPNIAKDTPSHGGNK